MNERVHHVHVEHSATGTRRFALPSLEGLPWDSLADLPQEVRRRNDALAEGKRQGDTALGLLPFPYEQEAIREVRRIGKSPDLDGFCLVPVVGRHSWDQECYRPLLRAIDAKGGPLLLHPIETGIEPLENPRSLDALLALSRLLYFDGLRTLAKTQLVLSHTGGAQGFLADNLGMLHYLQAKRWRMGAFLADYLVRKRIRGVEYIRDIPVTTHAVEIEIRE